MARTTVGSPAMTTRLLGDFTWAFVLLYLVY